MTDPIRGPVPKGEVRIDREGGYFMWCCPTCGHTYYGTLGPEAVSGWDAPRWKLTGTEEKSTLEPSLGCRGMRDGTCTGHWWYRAGELVAA